MFLPEDILLNILGYIADEYGSLYCCSLVNHSFNHVASVLLYARVVFSPPSRPYLDLKKKDAFSEPSLFSSSIIPKYAQHARMLEISGYLPTRPPPINTFPSKLLSAVQAYQYLREVAFTPNSCHPDTFTGTLKELKARPQLQVLTVNSCFISNDNVPILVELRGLCKLTLYDPTRSILQVLPDWLGNLSDTLCELHLKNCGSITPGVLRGLIPHLRGITSLTLGLSYSLTDNDVFTFLIQLPHLTSAQLQYYLQLNAPKQIPPFTHLRSLTVKYSRFETRPDTVRFCVWIRRLISSSPLERLCLISDTSSQASSTSGANVSFDGLLDHFSKKHCNTLRSLDLGIAFVGPKAFAQLCRSCLKLEYIKVSTNQSFIPIFMELSLSMTKLRAAAFNVRNVTRNFHVDREQITQMFSRGPVSLQSLTINGIEWQGEWVVENHQSRFMIREIPQHVPPWRRNT